MASPEDGATSTSEDQDASSSTYECHICFEQAKDAVVSMCGHLFCWPCIHRWMENRRDRATCPVCKAVISKDKLIPLYGRGSDTQQDPRDTVPPRPQGQREEQAPQYDGNGFEGIQLSFGIGAFPFTAFGMPMLQMFNAGPQQGRQLNPQQREEQQRVTRILITIAVLVIIIIVLS